MKKRMSASIGSLLGREISAGVCCILASTAVIFALLCGSAAGQGVMKTAPAPNRNITLAGPQRQNPSAGRALPGTIEGFVYWDTGAVTHNPAGACDGFSVSVIAGGSVLQTSSGQFGAKYVGQVKSYLVGGKIVAYDVCTYAYGNLAENVPLRVELNITQPTAFSTAVAPATPIVGPVTIINAQCNMLPDIARATLADLSAYWGSCQDMAFDVNFQLTPAGLATRAAMLSPGTRALAQTAAGAPGSANNSSSGGTLLGSGSNATLLGRNQQTTGGSTSSGLQPLVPRNGTNGTSSTSSGNASGAGISPQPLVPRGGSNGTSSTGSNASSGTGTGPSLQPLIPRSGSSSGSGGSINSGASGGSSSAQGSQAEKLLKADLAKPAVRGKVITMSAKSRRVSPGAAVIAVLQKQRQGADIEEAQMMKLGIHPSSQVGVPTGTSEPMSASTGAGATQANNQAVVSTPVTAATGTTAKSGSQGILANARARVGISESLALMCAQDPTMRILTVSGSSGPATFTPIDQYNLYTIRGCSFGNQAPTNDQSPTDWVHIYGGSGSFYGKFAVRFWNDNEIDVSLDESISGFPDLDNLDLVVKRADGQQIQKGGFKFYAARQTVLLASIPQSWVTLASFPSPCGGSNTNCWYTEYSSPPASTSMAPYPAILPPGPYAGSAYVGRSSNGLKYAWLEGVNDYYDFTHLAPGWTTDPSDQQHQPQLISYDAKCPAGGGWTVTYKQSFGAWSAQWDGNNIQVGLSDTSCSGFFAPSLGIDNYQNWSGSYYALKVWVTGPRGTDPLTDNPAH